MRSRFIRDTNFPLYADISLQFPYKRLDVCAKKLRLIILSTLKGLFGDSGAAIELNVIKFRANDCRAYIRFPSKKMSMVIIALTVLTRWEDVELYFVINKICHSASSICLESAYLINEEVDEKNAQITLQN